MFYFLMADMIRPYVMAPNQRLAALVGGSILFLGIGWIFLVVFLTKKAPNQIETSITPVVDEGSEEEIEGSEREIEGSEEKSKEIEENSNTGGNEGNAESVEKPLTLLLPPRVRPENRDLLIEKLNLPKSPLIIQPQTFTEFLRAISTLSTGSRQADLMLIPWQEATELVGWAGRVDRRSEPPTQLFHPNIQELLINESFTFIPHAIDPRVTITASDTQRNGLGQFLQQFTQPIRGTAEQYASDPLLQQITAYWLGQFTRAETAKLIPRIFGLETSQEMIQMHFLPVSAISSFDENTLFRPIPTVNKKAPATIRGRVFRGNDTQEATIARLQFISTYLALTQQDALPYDEPLLPAFQARFQRIILQNQWSAFSGLLGHLDHFKYSSKHLKSTFTTLPFIPVLKGTYLPELYVAKWNELQATSD